MGIYSTRKMIVYGCVFIAGIVIVILNVLEIVPADPTISGFGGGFAGVAAVRLFLGNKYRKDENYAKQIDIANNDERTVFISNKAKSWAFYLTMVILAIAGMILMFIEYREYGMICVYIVCGMCFIYWVAYIILNKRY